MVNGEARTGFADGGKLYSLVFAKSLLPDPDMSISEWAARYRIVPSEASARSGPWSNDVVPFLSEIMDCLSPHHPCEEVTFCKSAQVAGTECGINFFGAIAHLFPGPMGIYLPSIDLLKKYNTQKLDPTINASPILRQRVAEQKSRDEKGSTTLIKKFPGGLCFLSTSSSSSALQSVSLKYLIKDELSEWPATLDDRGDPDTQVDKRTTAFIGRGRKIFNVSTPAIKGSCRITAKFMAGDQRHYYVPCPHCGHEQTLVWERLHFNDEPPYDAHYVCCHCGALIEPRQKREMIAKGRWIAEAKGEGRNPSFHINQLYSPFVPWNFTVAEYKNALGKPEQEKAFHQQVLGLAYEVKGEAPDADKLLERVEPYRLSRVPPGAILITGAADVQGNRLEYGIYAWDKFFSSHLIDKGVLEGDPHEEFVWKKLSEVIDRKYQDPWGNPRGIDAFGVDTGFASNWVYRFIRRQAHTERVYALDGRGGSRNALHPPIGTPRKRDINIEGRSIGVVMLYPVGTWPMKTELYASLRKTIAGPNSDGLYPIGTAHYPDACDMEYFKQLTAEYLAETDKRDGYVVRSWRKISGQANEALDIAVYARALAHRELDPLTEAELLRLESMRCGGPKESTLFSWAGASTIKVEDDTGPQAELRIAPNAQDDPIEETEQEAFLQPRRENWLRGRGDNWLGG